MTSKKQESRRGNSVTLQSDPQMRSMLIKELQRLKNRLNAGHELVLKWVPQNGELHGEVKGTTLFIYDQDGASALATLRHEFLDYVICQAIEPYRKVANKLMSIINEQCYETKEELIERLCSLI